MAKFRVTKTSFLNNQLHQPDAIVDHEGPYADNLEPVDSPVDKEQAIAANRTSLLRRLLAAKGVDQADMPTTDAELRQMLLSHGVKEADIPAAPPASSADGLV